MIEIKDLLEKKCKIESVRGCLVTLLDTSLDILQRVAIDFSPGTKLYRATSDYNAIHKVVRNFLSEEELKSAEERYKEIQKIWIEIKNEKKI